VSDYQLLKNYSMEVLLSFQVQENSRLVLSFMFFIQEETPKAIVFQFDSAVYISCKINVNHISHLTTRNKVPYTPDGMSGEGTHSQAQYT
jgi:hypothetical protein